MPQTAIAADHSVSLAAGNPTRTQEDKEKKKRERSKKRDLVPLLIGAGIYKPDQTVTQFCTELHRFICDRTIPEHVRHFHTSGIKAEFEVLGCRSERGEQVHLICSMKGKHVELDLPMSGIRAAYAAQVS